MVRNITSKTLLNELDIKIISLLRQNPRNISWIARRLNVPIETVRYRVNRLCNKLKLIRVKANIDYYKIGLKAFLILVEAPSHDIIEHYLNLDNALVFSPIYGTIDGYIAIYLLSRGEENILPHYLDTLRKRGIISFYRVLELSDLVRPFPRFDRYFNYEKCKWEYNFQGWVKELKRSKVRHRGYEEVINVDDVDALLLKELEEDAMTPLASIARKLGVSPQNLEYHYKEHILNRGLIRGFYIELRGRLTEGSIMTFMLIEFESKEWGAGFVETLMDKPFVHLFSYIKGKENYVAVFFRLNFEDYVTFLHAIKSLKDSGIINRADKFIMDIRFLSERGLPSLTYYSKGTWELKKSINVILDEIRVKGERKGE